MPVDTCTPQMFHKAPNLSDEEPTLYTELQQV